MYVSKKQGRKRKCVPPKKLKHISKYFLKAGTSQTASVHGHDGDDSKDGVDDDYNNSDDDVGYDNNDNDVQET